MPLTTGTCLGPYEIQSQLGAGGMGEVYRANDTRLDRTVAIKVLPAHVADDPDIRQRFEREAKTISSLNHPHPHICTLYDIGSQDGIDFLVMEYLEGDTLAQRLEKGALPLDQVLQVAIELTFVEPSTRLDTALASDAVAQRMTAGKSPKRRRGSDHRYLPERFARGRPRRIR